ncbi:MAG: hypothetical protein H0X30_28295 [Anaerolineae bacterium]|nr:hypothetical protein [Anaerolineae bacterium]
MDGFSAFSTLVLFDVLSTDAPLADDRSVRGVLKFDISFIATILATIIIWIGIGRVTSIGFIPVDLGLAVVITLGAVVVTFAVLFVLISRLINRIEAHINSLLNERHISPKLEKHHA